MFLAAGGGYYLGLFTHNLIFPCSLTQCLRSDTGASKLIIEGKIKVKNDAQISRFTQDGIVFDNGSKLQADVVVVATGYFEFLKSYITLLADMTYRFDDNRVAVSRLIGDQLGSQLPPIWGLNAESEPNSVWRDLGPVAPNMWPMLGVYARCSVVCFTNFSNSRYYRLGEILLEIRGVA